ncbi:hypothetical protein [Streptomyces sp. SP18CS02]|uniref:hypothetical protein n=1 Tax=Streptomyces sp. SP18CS02 TaxID=3002531 RepID=UPI002E7932FA|nr:hypothetical protein [Streptomyces sp. SP18CS02]MEE1754564.1 hypothetical protein [Streptomyces sp. SP18CS02]
MVKSLKAVSEVSLPAAGEVTQVNESLDGEPERLSTDPYGEGWIVRTALSGPRTWTASSRPPSASGT